MELLSPISVITSAILLLFLLKLVRGVKKSKTVDGAQKLPPGPWKLPLIGNMHHLALAGTLPHHALTSLAKKHGPIMHLQLGEISAVVISSPRMAKEVVKTNDLAFASRPELLSTTIVAYNNTDVAFSPYGAYWRQMRKICTMELLSPKKVRSFCYIREEEVWNLIESTRSLSGSPINLSQKIFSLIYAITCRSAFGKRYEDREALIALIDELSAVGGGFDVADIFPSVKVLHTLTGKKPKLVKLHKKIDQIFDSIIDEHKERRSDITTRGGDYGRSEEEDLVDVLLRLKETGGLEFPITSNNSKALILDMFSAGTDTSSTTIDWAMTEMIRNPRVMEKAQKELRLGLKGKKKIYESDIQELSYLKQVIKETMRLHPPLPLLLPRECREQCEIDGYNIPIKTKLIINHWAIGRDPEYWTDAESFMPERFESFDQSSCSNNNMIGAEFEYLPFGAGRRMCPGLSMGLINVELPLAQLLYHFNWKLPNGISPKDLDMSESFGATVKRKNDLYLIPTHYDHTMAV